MAYKYRIAPGEEWIKPLVERIIATGELPEGAETVYKGRNTVSALTWEGRRVSVKRYKLPILPNRVAYTLLRPSKARRAFDNARQLLSMGIATAEPYAYVEEYAGGLLRRSWMLCRHIDGASDMRYAERRPDFAEIAVNLAALMHRLHDRGVWVMDFSSGNVLMTEPTGGFVLIDINRMRFGVRDEERLAMHFSRIVDSEEAVRVLADAYGDGIEGAALKAFRDYMRKVVRKRRLKRLFHLKKRI